MNAFLENAMSMKEELVANRRYLHANAETGFDLPKTRDYVIKQLVSYGYEPEMLGGGVTCTVGKPGKTLLLRADMDALPQREESGLPFACQGNACHSCGHDMHTTMLLGAAKLLKEQEEQLKGYVKFMFQPSEETLQGCKSMVEAGILENPKVDAAMVLHQQSGPSPNGSSPAGKLFYTTGKLTSSADEFEINITGRSAHSSAPHQGISALSAAVDIYCALQKLVPTEVATDDPTVLSVCSLHCGTASNIIPDSARLLGSFRTYTPETRQLLLQRCEEIVQAVAVATHTQAEFRIRVGTAPVVNDRVLAEEMIEYCKDAVIETALVQPIRNSEDFAYISTQVPSFYALLCAGDVSEGYDIAMHNPKIRFDEESLPYGVAVFCTCAVNWLKNHHL